MIDRRDAGSAVGSDLLRSSARLFHWWHKYHDGKMAWSTFLGYARPIRWGVGQALSRGTLCVSEKTASRSVRYGMLCSDGNRAVERPAPGGSRFVERVLSVAATYRLQGRNVLEYLTACFRAQHSGQRLTSLLP